MLKKYKNLETAIKKANFNPMEVVLGNGHLMGKHLKNNKWFICHIMNKDGYYVIDSCKAYDSNIEASLVMINLISRGAK